ncbi:hypothetical protein GLW08_03245 [Pontibacillus yanchengensis]|uniref:Uncharacterized protein n=2 Tax=Pontibacillus yanchengensis TaxID=462910 RepID=A0ACC7VDX3_9BACI|nr:hypothetical protein [Pontibacillus yanchengensis]MYL35320.1 hypothetical protein [Pontibacillus yanchengensis]MYL52349.1 hypothetical protein [Pontibacillus yanchengensis]
MKWKLFLIGTSIICLLSACNNEDQVTPQDQNSQENQQESETNGEKQTPKKGEGNQVKLTFQPADVKKLKTTQPKDEWEKVGTKAVSTTKDKKGSLMFYSPFSKQKETNSEKKKVKAILNVNDTYYDIGIVGQYGMDTVDIQQVDVTNDDQTEILITGGMGPTSNEMNVIGFQNENVVNLLTAGNGDLINIDNDDSKELVSHSKRALPPYVWIYRWNKDHFEKADVADATTSKAALIKNQGNQKVIKVVKEKQDPKYFHYSKGNLKPVTVEG